MRLRVARKAFISRTVAAVLALLVCGSALNWGHVGGDDRDCDVVVTHHDHAAHRFSTAPINAPDSGDHCYICHSLRLLHHAVTSRHERVAIAVRSVHHIDGEILAVRDGRRIGIAPRAPPSVRL